MSENFRSKEVPQESNMDLPKNLQKPTVQESDAASNLESEESGRVEDALSAKTTRRRFLRKIAVGGAVVLGGGGVVVREILKKTEGQDVKQQERGVSDYIEANKESVADALSRLVKDSRFVLVGEAHLEECESLRREVISALAKLQKEGLTHIALEAPSVNQEIIDSADYSDPNIKKILQQRHVAGSGWLEGNYDILIAAKKLGLKVALIDYDDGRPDSERDNANWQNLRDGRMIKTINGQIDEESKMLIFIGSAHVHKKEVTSYDDGKVKCLGMRLVEQYGEQSVKSVRYVNRRANFDNLPAFMSKTPTPESISKGKEEVLVIPDDGPVKGDVRVSAADYIVAII